MAIEFSICIAAYKQKPEYLRECLGCVFSQTYRNFEVVICQQGDDDLGWLKEEFPKIKICYREKPSLYGARRTMIDAATGDYVWLIDGDDKISGTTALEEIADAIETHDRPDMVLFPLLDHDVDFPDAKDELLFKLLTCDSYNSVFTKIFRRDLKPNFPDFDVFQSEDKAFSLCLVQMAKTVLPIKKSYYWYRPNEDSGTHVFNQKRMEDRAIVALWIEKEFPGNNDRFLGYAAVLYDYFSILLQGRSCAQLTKTVLSNALSNPPVVSFLSLVKGNWSKTVAKTTFIKKMVYKAIVNRRYGLLIFILDAYLDLKKPFSSRAH